MRLAAIRGATAGCVGALALAVVLVAVEPRTEAQRRTDASLDRSGVVVVAEAANDEDGDGGAFDDPAETLGLAGLAVLYGVIAGAVLALLAERFGHALLVAVALAAVAVVVLAAADRFTGRDVGAQVAFWVVAAGWLWWAGRDVSRAASPRRP